MLSSPPNHSNDVPNSHWFANHGHEYRSSDQLPSTALQRFTGDIRVLSTRPHSSIALCRPVTQHLRGHPGNPKVCPRTGCKQYRPTQTHRVPGTDLLLHARNAATTVHAALAMHCAALGSNAPPACRPSSPTSPFKSRTQADTTQAKYGKFTKSTQPHPRFVRSN